MIVSQESAEPLSTSNGPFAMRFGDSGKQQHVAFPLVTSFFMVVVDIGV
jgi:hypothetical protein